jgi:hypothetical protein
MTSALTLLSATVPTAAPSPAAPSEAPGGALVGALDTLALADVLQLLDLGRRTGVLAVDAGDGARRGLVRMRGGLVAAARFRRADGHEVRDPVDAVAAMLALTAGRFTFAADPPAPPAATPAGALRVETVLMEASRRLDLAPVPDPAFGADPHDRVPTLADDHALDEASAPPLVLLAADWALLAEVDGRRTVSQVAAAAGQATDRAADALDALARAGIVHLAEPRARRDAGGDVARPPARSSGC